jgi:hypothetical protein
MAGRLVALRCEIFGNHGSAKMAERLGVPARSWYSYERGMAVPPLLILKFIEEFSVEPEWLLHGTGPRFRLAGAPLTGASFRLGMRESSPIRSSNSHVDQERISAPVSA